MSYSPIATAEPVRSSDSDGDSDFVNVADGDSFSTTHEPGHEPGIQPVLRPVMDEAEPVLKSIRTALESVYKAVLEERARDRCLDKDKDEDENENEDEAGRIHMPDDDDKACAYEAARSLLVALRGFCNVLRIFPSDGYQGEYKRVRRQLRQAVVEFYKTWAGKAEAEETTMATTNTTSAEATTLFDILTAECTSACCEFARAALRTEPLEMAEGVDGIPYASLDVYERYRILNLRADWPYHGFGHRVATSALCLHLRRRCFDTVTPAVTPGLSSPRVLHVWTAAVTDILAKVEESIGSLAVEKDQDNRMSSYTRYGRMLLSSTGAGTQFGKGSFVVAHDERLGARIKWTWEALVALFQSHFFLLFMSKPEMEAPFVPIPHSSHYQ